MRLLNSIIAIIGVILYCPEYGYEGAVQVQVEDEPATYMVTAYCAGECCCGEYADGITASGEPAKGFFVAAPPEIPFGTLVIVPGYNEGKPVEVLDRGGAIKGNRLDMFFATHKEALNFGVQYLEVRFL